MLASLLRKQSLQSAPATPEVIALPRGGVPIGFEIAKELHAPLDILVTRKIGAPDNPEYGIGAITEGGYFWLDEDKADSVGATPQQIHQILIQEEREVRRRTQSYRKALGYLSPQTQKLTLPAGKDIILVDDGLATGVTARVAVHYLRQNGAGRVILAVPVASHQTATLLRREVDELVCLQEVEVFYAVGQFYEDFTQVTDEEVVSLLAHFVHRGVAS